MHSKNSHHARGKVLPLLLFLFNTKHQFRKDLCRLWPVLDGAPPVDSSGRGTVPKEEPPRLVHQAGAFIRPKGIIAAAVKTRNRCLSAKTGIVLVFHVSSGPHGLQAAARRHAGDDSPALLTCGSQRLFRGPAGKGA